jgi:hypothetical protein
MEANNLFGLLFTGIVVGLPVLGVVDAGLIRVRRWRQHRRRNHPVLTQDRWKG